MKPWKVFLALDAIVLAAVAVAAVSVLHGRPARTVRTGVVLVDADLGHGTRTEGTGIVLTRGGEVLTNNHVIEGANAVRVRVPQTGKTYSAHILGYDIATDAALLQLDHAPGLRTAPTAPLPPHVGERVLAVGGSTGAVSFSVGHITGLRKTISAGDELGGNEHLRGMIEFDASVSPGDSGGPLLDLHGDVVGVDTAGAEKPGFFSLVHNVHDSYAIPIGQALAVAHEIEAGRDTTTLHVGPTAFLGVELDPSAKKARVAVVVPGSPAARAGLQTAATITTADGRAVTSSLQVVQLLLNKNPGDHLRIGWGDAGGAHSATVLLVAGPAL